MDGRVLRSGLRTRPRWPVIYISERKYFYANAHFDLRPFYHISYSDAQELKRPRVKIAAWIGSLNPEYKVHERNTTKLSRHSYQPPAEDYLFWP